MNFSALENALWALGFLGNTVLLSVLLSKKRFLSFPVFTFYICFQVVETTILFAIAKNASFDSYFKAYWSFAAGDYALQIAIVFEIARDVFRPTGRWVVEARGQFLIWAAGGTIVAAAFATAMAPPGKVGPELWAAKSSLFTSFLTCEIFLAMSVAANRLGLQWRSHIMSLGQGLTFWAAIALTADIAHYTTGWRSDMRGFDAVRSLAYVATTFFWAFRFYSPERPRAPLSSELQQYLVGLHESVRQDLGVINPESTPRL